jgi:hypothetical protein
VGHAKLFGNLTDRHFSAAQIAGLWEQFSAPVLFSLGSASKIPGLSLPPNTAVPLHINRRCVRVQKRDQRDAARAGMQVLQIRFAGLQFSAFVCAVIDRVSHEPIGGFSNYLDPRSGAYRDFDGRSNPERVDPRPDVLHGTGHDDGPASFDFAAQERLLAVQAALMILRAVRNPDYQHHAVARPDR